MAYFNHAFKKTFVGTHDTVAQATYVNHILTAAAIDKGFVTTSSLRDNSDLRIRTSDLQDYGMGLGSFAFFDKSYDIVVAADLSGEGATPCCPLYLVAASIRTNDKIGPFHGGYQESNKSKLINPRYISKVYRVDHCHPQQSVVSIGTTEYTGGGISELETITDAGAGYTNGTYYNVRLLNGTGTGARATVVVAGNAVTSVTVTSGGINYVASDVLTVSTVDIPYVAGHVATVTVHAVSDEADATCCKSFYCGETYYLRIDLKGSPVLRTLNHNAYQTLDAYTGCCSGATPTVVDPTLVYIMWADRIIINNYLKDFVLPAVYDYAGNIWYSPNETTTPSGGTIPSYATTAGGTVVGTWDNYTLSKAYDDWTDTTPCSAGMRLYGAFVETTFQNCTFQVTDKYELEPVRIYASLTDLSGDPCTFEGLCVYHECDGLQAMGYGEQVLRDLILSESYLQNFFHSQLREREITGGTDVFNAITRSSYYTRYYILHSVPRYNNPSGTFDNDQYLLEIITTGQSTSLEAFLTAWLFTAKCSDCYELEVEDCTPCVIVPEEAIALPPQ